MRNTILLLTTFLATSLFSANNNQPGRNQNQPKIIFATVPKAGTHLLMKAITLITKQNFNFVDFTNISAFDVNKDLMSPIITGTHIFPEIDIIRTRYTHQYIKVLMIRDPRDVMVSFMNHLNRELFWAPCNHFDREAFKLMSEDEQLRHALLYPTDCVNPMDCFQTAAEWTHDPTVFVCRFEDIIGAKGGGSDEKQKKVLFALAAHLGHRICICQVNSIAEQIFGKSWSFFKGQIGAWKTSFNEENKQLFKMLVGQSVIDLGYETDYNW